MTPARRAAVDLGGLAALGAGVVAVTVWTARWDSVREHAAAFAALVLVQLLLAGLAAAWVLWRRPPRRAALALVMAVGAAALITLVPVRPDVSGDVYRYVWDGRVQAEGINPYRHAPEAAILAPLRDEAIYPGINRKPVPTIYPPAAQATFLGVYLLHPDSVAWTKLVMVLAALAAALALARLLARLGRPPALALLFAWHPLVALEVGRGGHLDALAALAVLLALLASLRGRPLRAGAAIGAAILMKPYAALTAPALAWSGGRRRALRLSAGAAAVGAAVTLPYVGVGTGILGYLPGYLQEEGYASGRRYHLADRLGDLVGGPIAPFGIGPAGWYPALVAVVLGAMVVHQLRRPPAGPADVLGRALATVLVATALTTPTYPWYLVLLAALAPLGRPALAAGAVALGGVGPLLYLQWWLPDTPDWPLDLVWGVGAAALLAGVLTRRRAQGACSPTGTRRARRFSDGESGQLQRGSYAQDGL